MTRALGDAELTEMGVGHDAEVSCVVLDPAARFVILATDGVWDVMNDDDAVDLVCLCLDAGRGLDETARRLCEQALLRGSADNISAVVMALSKRS
jgi:serine/threonine protein phosphatase PrpC